MKRGTRSLLLTVMLALAVGLLVWLWRVPQPKHEGQPLSYWITELEAVHIASDSHSSEVKMRRERAERAMKELGPKAMPQLTSMLDSRDTRLNSWIYDQVQKRPFLKLKFDRADQRRWKACQALKAMGPAAGPAVPRLVELLAGFPDDWAASEALESIGRPAALPLTAALTNGSGAASSLPFDILGRMGDEASDAVPALIAVLDQTNQFCRAWAVRALGAIGQNPGELLPRFTAMLQRGDLPFDVAPAICILDTNGPVVLLRSLTNEHSTVRLAALSAMEIGFTERGKARLRRAWKDRKQAWNLVSHAAGRTNELASHLTITGESNVLAQVLVTILCEGEPEERETAADMLKHFKSEKTSILAMLDQIQKLDNANIRAVARRASEQLRMAITEP